MSAFDTNSAVVTFNYATSNYFVHVAGKTIETTVTDNPGIAEEWLRQIRSLYAGIPTLVGLDTEWSLLPNKKAAVLQLCVDERCLIIQLVYMEDNIPLSTLESFLTDSNFTFVGIEVAQDIAKLKHEYGLECNKSMDIGRLAKRGWPGRFRGPSLKELASELLGIDMRKPEDVCLSNWEAKVLNENQIEYACIDAYASYRIGHKLLLGEGAINL